MKLKVIGLGLLLVLLQSCAVQQRTLLTAQERSQIQTLNMYDLVIQDEVRPAIDISNVGMATGGGLIGAMIDSSIDKKRSRAAGEVTDPLFIAAENIDFRTIIAAELNPSVNSFHAIAAQKNTADAVLINDAQIKARLRQLAVGEYFLYTSSFYSMSNKSMQLNVETLAMMYKKMSNPKERLKPVYQNRMAFISDTVGTGNEDSIAKWSENNAQLLDETLRAAAKTIASQLNYDLQNTVLFECGDKTEFSFTGPFGPVKSKGVVIETADKRSWVRQEKSGMLFSVPQYSPLIKAKNTNCTAKK